MPKADIAAALRPVLPGDCLLWREEDRRPYECDALTAFRRLPALVAPGVPNLRVSEEAAAHGLYYAPDPSSQVACSIGGNVAENSGGVHCLKYGLTVHNVRRVRG